MDHDLCERYRWVPCPVCSTMRREPATDHPEACVAGSSIICIDLLIQCFPQGKNFRIEDSDSFLSSSLSLSFGVMVSHYAFNLQPLLNANGDRAAVLVALQHAPGGQKLPRHWRALLRSRSICYHWRFFRWSYRHTSNFPDNAPLHPFSCR